jgi:hypothetical protein
LGEPGEKDLGAAVEREKPPSGSLVMVRVHSFRAAFGLSLVAEDLEEPQGLENDGTGATPVLLAA